MENKYYQPSIEEFYIGFEYETIYLQDYDNWVKETLSQGDAIYFFDSYIADALPLEFRVKYLDKEDIESLGFKQSETDKNWYDYKNERFWLYKENDKDTNWTISDNESEVGFTGIIKNKSELKILLKQLNII